MALPGLSFEIVRTSAPVGIRADQTALIALTERGPVETPTLVHSLDEFTAHFGAVLPGALGALAAQGYYDNGGEQLIVTRFVPAEASAATATWGVVGVDPGRTPRTTSGQLSVTASPTVFMVTGLAPPVLPSDVNLPVAIAAGGSTVPATIAGILAGGTSVTVVTGPPVAGFPPALPASATLTLPATVPLVASGPGAYGNGVQVETRLNLRRRTSGTPSSPSAGVFRLSALAPSLLPSDAGAPARLIIGKPALVQWGTITSVGAGGGSITFVPGPLAPGFPPSAWPASAIAEVYDPTFSLTILEPARANVVVSGLDLRDLGSARALLTGTSVTIAPVPGEVPLVPGAPPLPPELPLAGRVSFAGGVDGLSPFAPDAASASATVAVVGATAHAPPFALQLAADEPGSESNGIVVTTSLAVKHFTLGEIVAIDPDNTLRIHGLEHGDEGFPAMIVAGTPGVTIWGKIQAPTSAGHRPVFLPGPGAAAVPTPLPQPAVIRVYEPTFSATVSQSGQPTTSAAGLDLRDLDATRALLAVTPVTIPPGALDSMEVELPVPGPVTLSGGSNGTLLADRIANLSLSFQNCIDALEVGEQPPTLPDVVIAPDLWSAIWGTKGEAFLAFDHPTAIALADQMVLSAWRTSDRVVLVDPPLRRDLQPYSPEHLVAWRAERYAALGPSAASGPLVGLISAGTDFAATFSPWVQIVAGGTFRGDDTLLMPPSAYVAGRMARTSRERGPWIATGNVSLEDIVGLDERLSIQDQEILQAAGISPLRVELPMGATIQGVRSLSWPDRLAWGYLSTRRLFNFLRRVLRPIGLSYVFESNTPATWLALRRDLTRVLRDIFLAGGLAGSKPSDGFYVKIDDALNPPSAIDAGVMTAQIGVAPAIPLEFLVVLLVLQDNTASVTEAPP